MKRRPLPGCEVDYWKNLTPEQRRWLKQFNDEFGNGYFSKDKKAFHTKNEKRAIWRSRNSSRKDLYAKAMAVPLAAHHGGNYSPQLEEALDASNCVVNLADFLKKRSQ